MDCFSSHLQHFPDGLKEVSAVGKGKPKSYGSEVE